MTGPMPSPEWGKRELLISRFFRPEPRSHAAKLCYFFVDPAELDFESIRIVAAQFPGVHMERSLAAAIEKKGERLPEGTHIVEDCVNVPADGLALPRVAFLASNDTHANFMLKISESFKDVAFVIPRPADKDEKAGARLRETGVTPIELGFKDTHSPELERFAPDVILAGADWTDEFHAIHGIGRRLQIPCISLQEGPQYWHMTRGGQYANKYRNAEILLAQGRVTLREIHPRYFAITGNPKIDRIQSHALPSRPKVFINCNFTYGQWETAREQWMNDCLSVCRELGLDYLISKHPRDTSQWDDPNLVNSNTFVVKDQLLSCSIVVSRLSSITYEALGLGRESVYYNPHGEPIPTFNDDKTPGILKALTRAELMTILARHQSSMNFDRTAAEASLKEHCGPPDGRALERVIEATRAAAANRLGDCPLVETKTFSLASYCTQPPQISAIYGFRDRDPASVVRSVVSLRASSAVAFQPIVVDYGSGPEHRVPLQNLCKENGIKFIRADTMGWPWSRAHALNIGARQAGTEFLMFTDIDMVFEGDILGAALEKLEDKSVIHCRPMWLPPSGDRSQARQGNHDQKGGFMFIRRDLFADVGGFDERFRFWGLEDLDMNNRLTLAGAESIWLDDFKQMFHVWHPLSYGFDSTEPKAAWYDSVRAAIANQFTPAVNGDWGRAVTLAERPIITRMNQSKPDYYKVAFNRLHLDFNALMTQKLRGVKSGDFLLVALGPRFTDGAQKFLERHPRLVRWLEKQLARRGFALERFQNRNIDYLWIALDQLRAAGLKDFFIKPDLSMVYLLF